MNYLCAVLLLAFAAGSVHSSLWTKSEYYKEAFENTFKEQCDRHFPKKIPCVPLLSPITISIGSILKEVTGVEMLLLSISLSLNNYALEAKIDLDLTCDLFSAIKVFLFIHLELNPILEEGCVFLTKSNLSATLSLNGEVISLNEDLIDRTLKSLEGHVKEVTEDIVDNVLLKFNLYAKTFGLAQNIGGNECKYFVRDVEKEDGLFKGTCCFVNEEEESECSEEVDAPAPVVPDAVSTVTMTDKLLLIMLKTSLIGLLIQLQVPKEMSGDFGSMNLRITFIAVKTCAFKTTGMEAEIYWKLKFFNETDSETAMVSMDLNQNYTGQITQRKNNWGIKLQARDSDDWDLTMQDDTCKCWDSMSVWLSSYIQYILNTLNGILNTRLDLCFTVPNIGGINHPIVVVTPGQGYCQFSWKK